MLMKSLPEQAGWGYLDPACMPQENGVLYAICKSFIQKALSNLTRWLD